MIGQFINRFSEGFIVYPSNFLTFSGYVAMIVAIYSGFQFWKNGSNWRRRRARLIKFASTLTGPRTLPIFGNALEFACKSEDILERVINICLRHEEQMRFRIWMGPKLLIVTMDPRDYEVILGSAKASHKDSIYRFMEPVLGQGLVNNSGPTHKAHRKIIMPMMNNKALGIFAECFERHSRTCADLLEEKAGTGEFDISSYMTHFTFNVTLETIMGTSINTQSINYQQLIQWTERVYQILHKRMMKAWLYVDEIFYLTQSGKNLREGANFIHTFVENVIVRKKKEYYSAVLTTEEPAKPRVMLLEQLISHIEKANDMNDVELRDEIYTMFTAAQDTTATISTFACLMLAMHPDIQDKVRAEVMEVVGNEAINEQHLAHLKYLEMVIRENIRLYPVAPLIVRQLTGDVELDTCTLPEGCSVILVPFMTQRNPKYWKEPERFMPERFLPENSVGRPQFANISFSGGIRSCIGQKYAIMLMKSILAHVVRRYRLSSPNKLEHLRLKTDISIRSRDGYKLSLTKIE